MPSLGSRLYHLWLNRVSIIVNIDMYQGVPVYEHDAPTSIIMYNIQHAKTEHPIIGGKGALVLS